MLNVFIVGLGGIIGAISRYLIEDLVKYISGSVIFPYGTLTVNLLGCLIIGILFALIDSSSLFGIKARLFLITGILGALTTFSSFGWDTFTLLHHNYHFWAVFNILVEVVFGFLAVWLGYMIVKIISSRKKKAFADKEDSSSVLNEDKSAGAK